MKNVFFYVLTAIVCLLAISCEKNEDAEAKRGYSVIKLKNSNYSDWLYFGYNSQKGKVTAYVDSSDAGSTVFHFNLTSLNKDYFLVNTTTFNKTAYSDITVSEYKEIWKATEGKDIRDTLTSRIIDTDPYVEIYEILPDYGDSVRIDTLYLKIWNYNYRKSTNSKKLTEDDSITFVKTRDEILKMIENYEGVKKVK